MSFEDIKLPENQELKYKADIVFVIDNSQSMDPVKQEINRHIEKFTEQLQNKNVNYRIGFVFYGHDVILLKHLTEDVNEFINSLEKAKSADTGWNEFTLPALDLAADFNWRKNSHRYIVVFTNEDIYGGYEADEQVAKFDWLLEKLKKLNIKVFYIGAECDYYKRFKDIPGSFYMTTKDFKDIDFDELFDSIVKSISQSCMKKFESNDTVDKDIFNVRDFSTFMVKVIDL